MDKPADIVRKSYNELAATYDAWAESVRTSERIKYLEEAKDRFASSARILDVGCGTGLLNSKPLSEKFDVVGIDVSERQIAEARKNVEGAAFICADIQEHDFDPGSFDGIVSFYCFNHIPRGSYSQLLTKFHSWLRDGGAMILSFGTSDEEQWTGDWMGATTFFSSHSRPRTLSLIEESGFTIDREVVEVDWEDDREVPFLWVTAEKKTPYRDRDAHH